MSEELVLPEKCLRCGGPLDVQTYMASLRLNAPGSKARTEPVAFCPKCRITYFPTKKYANIYAGAEDK